VWSNRLFCWLKVGQKFRKYLEERFFDEQQLEIKEKKVKFISAENLVLVGERFDSPYDAEAKLGKRRSPSWQGYKVHLTETCGEDSPNLITNVITTEAFIPDSEVNFEIHIRLKANSTARNTSC